MQQQSEYECDEFVQNLDVIPPPAPEEPAKRRRRLSRKRVKSPPPNDLLVSVEFYNRWVKHIDKVKHMEPKVDTVAPPLDAVACLQPSKVTKYAYLMQDIMTTNKELLEKICLTQRDKGMVDCWESKHIMKNRRQSRESSTSRRRRQAEEVEEENFEKFERIQRAKSDIMGTKEMDKCWKITKKNLIQGSKKPFVLFHNEGFDKGMKDPAFIKPENVHRNRVLMNINIPSGNDVGKLYIELFEDIAPVACRFFLKLIKGDKAGYAYSQTKIFRIVPGLFCRGGDVVKNNGCGVYTKPNGTRYRVNRPTLKHSVPGVVSLVANKDGKVNGQFNILFKPLPQFDETNVIVGRIVSGPADCLTRISAQGMPLGRTAADVILDHCGTFSKRGVYRKGAPNTRKFPQKLRG